MSRFRRVQKLISQLPEDHYASGLKLSDRIVPALEYFLSLEQVPGFQEKLEDLKLKPVGARTTNAPAVQWASLCAELGRIALAGEVRARRSTARPPLRPPGYGWSTGRTRTS